MPELLIRAMQPADLRAVFALQCRAHPVDYHEPVEALESRLEAGQGYCFVAELNALAGYIFAHPWAGEPPVLHALLQPDAQADHADHVFLHDLAVCPSFRGMSAGQRLHAAVQAHAVASGFGRMQLVAVGAAKAFWQGRGFEVVPTQRVHASYGEAVLMQRSLLPREKPAAVRSSSACRV